MHSNQTNKPFSWTSRMIIVPGDGNCFFHAIARELNRLGLEKSITHTEVRARGIRYLRDHPNILNEFYPENETAEQYLNRMSKVDTWAEGAIIDAVTAEFNISLQIMENRNNKDLGFMNINNVPNVRANIGLIHLNDTHYNILNIEGNDDLESIYFIHNEKTPSIKKENPVKTPLSSTQIITQLKNESTPSNKLKNDSHKHKKEKKPVIEPKYPLILAKKPIQNELTIDPELCALSKKLENKNISLTWEISKSATKSSLTAIALGCTLIGVTNILAKFNTITSIELAVTPVLVISLLTALIISIPGAALAREYENSLHSAKLHINKKDYSKASLVLDHEINRWIAAPLRFFFLSKNHYALANTFKKICLDNEPTQNNNYVFNSSFKPTFNHEQKVKLIKLKFHEESTKLVKIPIEKDLQEEIENGSINIIQNCGNMSLRDIDAMLKNFFNRLIRSKLNHPKLEIQAELTKLIEFIHAFKNRTLHQFDQNGFDANLPTSTAILLGLRSK